MKVYTTWKRIAVVMTLIASFVSAYFAIDIFMDFVKDGINPIEQLLAVTIMTALFVAFIDHYAAYRYKGVPEKAKGCLPSGQVFRLLGASFSENEDDTESNILIHVLGRDLAVTINYTDESDKEKGSVTKRSDLIPGHYYRYLYDGQIEAAPHGKIN
jgi:hypothetical protein